MKLLLIAIAATGLAACASTGSGAGSDAAAQASTAAPPVAAQDATVAALNPEDPGYWDEIICRREPVTGTRLTRARCHSRYDWARMRGAASETMRDITSQPNPCLDGPGCGPSGPGD
jgi:predicted small secreted protein